MNILYVARHGPQDNQDEDAITYALTQLGHNVVCVPEQTMKYTPIPDWKPDFTLFNKPEDLPAAMDFPGIKCFYYFDLVRHDDFQLRSRSNARVEWMLRVQELFDVGFMTDGDWVKSRPDKLIHLMQGADERVIGVGTPSRIEQEILFTGTTIHGSMRMSFCDEMKNKYRRQFMLVGDRGRSRIHGRELANLMASVKIVVAPDSPVTDLYWSNRVYQALGFGAFLLHPRCKLLESQFQDGKEIVFYDNRPHLHDLIRYFLHSSKKDLRKEIGAAGLERVKREHLYRHRCQVLVDVMSMRINNAHATQQ